MKKYIYFFLLGLFVAAITLLYFKDPGSIRILWLGYEINLSVVTGLSLFLATTLVYLYLRRLMGWLYTLLCRWEAFFHRFRRGKTSEEELLALAHTSLQSGLWQDARAYLSLLLKKDPTFKVYQLLAILELQEKHDFRAAITWLEKGLAEAQYYPTMQ